MFSYQSSTARREPTLQIKKKQIINPYIFVLKNLEYFVLLKLVVETYLHNITFQINGHSSSLSFKDVD